MTDQTTPRESPDPAGARAGSGVVAAAFPDAAEAGAAVLRGGGNAVDAACAAAWALCVCEPAESGLGGQTTMLIRLADGRCTVVDGHSHAPAALTRKTVKRKSQKRGLCSTTVPSTPVTLAEAQRLYGRLTLAEVLAPAIVLAHEGYRVTKLQRRLLKWTVRFFGSSSPEAGLFLKADGSVYREGEVFRQPALGGTLQRLADVGVGDFYEGQIARDIAEDMRQRGGLITAGDLRDLGLPVVREPLEIDYRGHRVLSIPPPGGGVQVLLALRVLGAMAAHGRDEASWRVALAEATRASFQERERWPDHPADFTPSLAGWIVSAERAREIVARFGKNGPSARAPDSLGEAGNTTHLCAADRDGNVVSLTQSIQSVFGSKVANPRLGFVYNNYLSTCPRTPHPYRLGPGCLPQSNAAPTLVLRATGEPVLVLGSAGSRRITSSVVQVVSAVLDRGQSLAGAVGAPRVHALLKGSVWVEESVSPEVHSALRARFARVRARPPGSYKMGAVQAIGWDGAGVGRGVADPRRDGAAVGP